MSTIELSTTARAYRELQAEIKALEEQADALKQQMIREMDTRNAEKLQAGEYTIRWSLYESSRLDSKALKADHGELYAAYCKPTVSTRFQVAYVMRYALLLHERGELPHGQEAAAQ